MTDRVACEDLLNHQECRDLLVFSRESRELPGQVTCLERCECTGGPTWIVDDPLHTQLHRLSCDELGEEFEPIELHTLEILRHFLRHLPPCRTWGGYHAGRADIATGQGVFRGEMYGVDSLVPEYQGQCCNVADPENPERRVTQSRGTFIGTGLEALDGWSLVANYTIRYPRDSGADPEASPCDSPRWEGRDIHITGVIARPCKQ